MKYNPDIHHRRSIRLRNYDYSSSGSYFITICVQHRKCIFGHVENGEMILNEFGEIAYNQWENLPGRWPHIELGAFQIMPNHMHGIIVVTVGSPLAGDPATGAPPAGDPATGAPPKDAPQKTATPSDQKKETPADNRTPPDNRAPARGAPTASSPPTQIQWAEKPTIGQIVGAYKSLVSTECLNLWNLKHPGQPMGKLWQRNFWEHIIRSVEAFDKISHYIIRNPAKWAEDKFYGK